MPQYNRQTYKYQSALRGLMLLDDAGRAIAKLDDAGRIVDATGDISKARFLQVGGKRYLVNSPAAIAQTLNVLKGSDFNPNFLNNVQETLNDVVVQMRSTTDAPSASIPQRNFQASIIDESAFIPQGQGVSMGATTQGISQVPIRDVTPVVGSTQPLAFNPPINPVFVAAPAATLAFPTKGAAQVLSGYDTAAVAKMEGFDSPAPTQDTTYLDSVDNRYELTEGGKQLSDAAGTTPQGMGRPETWYDDLLSAFGPFGDIFKQTYAENPGMLSIAALAILNKLHRGLSMSKNFNINDINARRLAKGLPTLTMDDLIASATTKASQMSYGDQLALLRLVDKDLFRPTKGQGFFKNFYNSAINSLPFMMKRPFAPFFVPGKAAFNKMFDNPAMTKKVAEIMFGRQTYRNPYLPFRGGQVKDVKVDNDVISVGTNLYGQDNFDRLFKISGGRRDLELSDFLNEEFGFMNADKIDDAGNYKVDEVKKFGINAEGFSMNQANSRLMGASRFKDGAKRFLFYVEDVIENPDGDNIGGFFEIFIGNKGKPSKIDFIQQAEFIGAEGPVTYNPKKTGGMFGRGDAFMGVPSDGTLPNTIRSNSRVNIWADKPTIKELGGRKELAESRDYNFNFSTFGIGNVTDEKALDNLLKIGKDLNKQWLDTKNPNTQFYLDEFNPKLSIRSGLPFYRFGGTAGEMRQMMDGYYPEIGSPVEDMFSVPLLV